jgi:RsiW-degrading membrane proteinase PrsW (M82 family)
MYATMMAFFKSWFVYPGLSWEWLLLGIALAVVFGAIWLAAYWPPLFKKPWLWAVLAGSAVLTLLAITYVQIPLQSWIGQALSNYLSQDTLLHWLLLAAIPQILVGGLVQEGAKMVPVVLWWWRSGRRIDPQMGLLIGAVAGAGLGIFEAVWSHNQIFMSGWTWAAVQTSGMVALAGFWERFIIVAFHTSVAALVGYGLARGWGWQSYLIAGGLHGLMNYSALFYRTGIFSGVLQVELYAGAIAGLLTAAGLWLRWRKGPEMLSPEPVMPGAGESPPPGAGEAPAPGGDTP